MLNERGFMGWAGMPGSGMLPWHRGENARQWYTAMARAKLLRLIDLPSPLVQLVPTEPCTAIDLFNEGRGEPKLGGKVVSAIYRHYPNVRDNPNSYGSFQETLFSIHPEVALAIAASRRKIQWGLASSVLIATSSKLCLSCHEWLGGFEAEEGIKIRVGPWGGERKAGWTVPGACWGLEVPVEVSNTRARNLLEGKAGRVARRWKDEELDSLSSTERYKLRQAQQDARRKKFGVPRVVG
ncbi:hypothetical protein TWF192_010553 [Orbilia oligospora]|uniref:Uncharacterized protein n=1 Tax=Orbilia oligospora TaxID=2813651 RepID=A0A6G1MI82_ORBOL|nr:hypothetical protein TWF679_009179 [Orbilia oligospora]KAF3225979.1 hypothetical protein TWF191_005005 [Orbilia oligospora]KAF3259698.1 hypothetical protein TWF192_010553 [Orbilia oligospora]